MTWCGPPSLLERSYALPPRFPFPPMRLIMERTPGSCDFYQQRAFCADVAADLTFEPEYHVREVIASFLTGCHQRTCHAIDLGANNGWFSLMMLALGAHVTSAEPQSDFAAALRDTAELNCAAARATVMPAFVSASRTANGTQPVPWGWRGGGFPAGLRLPDAPVVPLDALLPPPPTEVTFLKLDGDGEDGRWLGRIEQLLREGRVRVRTMIIECNKCKAHVVRELQRRHNFSVRAATACPPLSRSTARQVQVKRTLQPLPRVQVYQLDMAIDKRWIDARGHDAYANFAPTPLPPFVRTPGPDGPVTGHAAPSGHLPFWGGADVHLLRHGLALWPWAPRARPCPRPHQLPRRRPCPWLCPWLCPGGGALLDPADAPPLPMARQHDPRRGALGHRLPHRVQPGAAAAHEGAAARDAPRAPARLPAQGRARARQAGSVPPVSVRQSLSSTS